MEQKPKLSGERRAAALTAAALLGAAVVFSLWVVVAVSRNGPVDFYVYYMAGSLARHRHSFYVVGRLAWERLPPGNWASRTSPRPTATRRTPRRWPACSRRWEPPTP